jgi:hypothetical protein
MLNLLRFRELADYSGSPEIAPDQPISGAEAYRRYEDHTRPFLHATGGQVLFGGKGATVIGPAGEWWDLILLVRHRDVQTLPVVRGQRGLSRLYRPSHSRPRGLQTRAGDLNTTRSRRWRHRLTHVAFALDAGPPLAMPDRPDFNRRHHATGTSNNASSNSTPPGSQTKAFAATARTCCPSIGSRFRSVCEQLLCGDHGERPMIAKPQVSETIACQPTPHDRTARNGQVRGSIPLPGFHLI